MTLFGETLTPLEVIRLGITIFFILFMIFAGFLMWINGKNVRNLLQQGQADKRAREKAVEDLLVTAQELADKTKDALSLSDQHAETLSHKIDENTELTIQAAKASAEAAHTANAMNEKIADTNKRIETIVTRETKR